MEDVELLNGREYQINKCETSAYLLMSDTSKDYRLHIQLQILMVVALIDLHEMILFLPARATINGS